MIFKKKWIFPNAHIDEPTLRSFEMRTIADRTNFKPADLETEIGHLNFFVFTPDNSMSANVFYDVYNDWCVAFSEWCADSNISRRAGCLFAFKLWNEAGNQQNAMKYLPLLIAAVCSLANLALEEEDFEYLKRVTIFCTPQSNGAIDVYALTTDR